MRSRFDEQLALLNRELIEMGALCEEVIALSAQALTEGNAELAARVAPLDQEIDRAAEVNGASSFYTALKLWIESLRGACERYREQALELAEKAETEEAKTRFTKLAEHF